MCIISKQKPIYIPQPVQSTAASVSAAKPPTPEAEAVRGAGARERARLRAMSGQQSTIVTGTSGLLSTVNTGGARVMGS